MATKNVRRFSKLKIAVWILLGFAAPIVLFILIIALGVWLGPSGLPRDLEAPPAEALPHLIKYRELAATQRAALQQPGSARHAQSPANRHPQKTYKDFEDFLRAQRQAGGDRQAIDLYMEMMRRWDMECRDEYNSMQSWLLSWRPGRGPWEKAPDLNQWVRRHADFLALVRRYCETSGVPMPGAQVYLDDLETRVEKGELKPTTWKLEPIYFSSGSQYPSMKLMPGFGSCQAVRAIGIMLLVEGQSRFEQGDGEGALKDCDAALKLCAYSSSIIDTMPVNTTVFQLFIQLEAWVNDPGKLQQPWRRQLLGMLDQFHAQYFTPEMEAAPLEALYLYRRAFLVQLLQYRWRAYTGSFRSDIKYNKRWTIPFLKKRINYPNPQTFVEAMRALRTRHRLDEFIKDYDRTWYTALASLRRPYAELYAETKGSLVPEHEKSLSNLFISASLPTELFQEHRRDWAKAEAKINLLRAVLSLQTSVQDHGRTSQTLHLSGTADSPWRDPFSGARLRMDDPTSPTFIYSVGPDLKDQGGRSGDDLAIMLR